MIPKYLCIPEKWRNEMTYIDHFYMDYLGQSRYVGIMQYIYDGITFYFIDNESYFGGPKPYGDWRMTWRSFPSSVTRHCPRFRSLASKPDVVHCHDWQTRPDTGILKRPLPRRGVLHEHEVCYDHP